MIVEKSGFRRGDPCKGPSNDHAVKLRLLQAWRKILPAAGLPRKKAVGLGLEQARSSSPQRRYLWKIPLRALALHSTASHRVHHPTPSLVLAPTLEDRAAQAPFPTLDPRHPKLNIRDVPRFPNGPQTQVAGHSRLGGRRGARREKAPSAAGKQYPVLSSQADAHLISLRRGHRAPFAPQLLTSIVPNHINCSPSACLQSPLASPSYIANVAHPGRRPHKGRNSRDDNRARPNLPRANTADR